MLDFIVNPPIFDDTVVIMAVHVLVLVIYISDHCASNMINHDGVVTNLVKSHETSIVYSKVAS